MLVVKRKNMVIGILVVLLIVTGYLNFAYNQNVLEGSEDLNPSLGSNEMNDAKVTVTDVEENTDTKVSEEENDISDTAATVSGSSNFFVEYRLERKNTREKEIELIKEIVENPKSDPEMKKEAQAQLLEITKNMEKELTIETLIKSKGFEDAVVILHNDYVNVIVGKQELAPEEVAQILDIVKRESGKKAENIKIIPLV